MPQWELTPANNISQEKALAAQRGELLLEPRFKIAKFPTYEARHTAIVNALKVSRENTSIVLLHKE